MRRVVLLVAALCSVSSVWAQIRIQAKPADRFVDSLGVNVHMEYTDTPYGRYSEINRRLQALGMRHVRDEINNTSPAFVQELRRIGTLGYRLCGLIEGGNDYPPLGTALQASAVVPMIRNLEPVIEAVEGPDEPDDGGFVYDGVPYPSGAINESEDLWNILKGSSEISFLPVLALSEGNPADFAELASITPPPIDYAAYGNMHAYQGGSVGDAGLDQYIHDARELTGADRLWTTEMGYHNNTNYLGDGEQQGVSERAAAIYLPIAFFSGLNHGVFRTFSYELIDESNDPHLNSGSGEGHYGLLRYDGSEKPAYAALKNLITILRDPGGKQFSPGSLYISFLGAPSTMRYTLLEKSNGDFYLALWNDVSVYRVATENTPGRDLYPPSVPVRLEFLDPKRFTVFAPNDASGAGATDAHTIAAAACSLTINLQARVLVIRIATKP